MEWRPAGMEGRLAYLQSFIVDRVKSLSLNGCLSLGVFALIREEVGLDVGI